MRPLTRARITSFAATAGLGLAVCAPPAPTRSAERADDGLPPAEGPSWLDRCAPGAVKAKLVLGGSLVIASREELEQAAKRDGAKGLVWEGTPRRDPPHWKTLPPLVQDVRFEPPLEVFRVAEKQAERVRIESLRGRTFLSSEPAARAEATPLFFDLPAALRPAVALLLVRGDSLSCMPAAASVKTSERRKQMDESCLERETTTTLDFDADGRPEVARVATEIVTAPGAELDCEQTREWGFVAVRRAGAWHVTSRADPLQDGLGGF